MRRSALLALVLLVAAAALPGTSRAQSKILAFGDSITVGTGWPMFPNSIFDCSGGCDSNNREECGYVRRLENSIGVSVVNLGVGAEKATQALTRIEMDLDSQCGSSGPGSCVTALFMHGTNDLAASSGISPETITAAVGTMLNKAKAHKVDAIVASVIRKVYDEDNSRWSNYKGKISTLANQKKVPFVNPWATLCTGDACFNNKYRVIGGSPSCGSFPGENDIGHLDVQGYDDLAPLFDAAIPNSAPSAPATTGPTGTSCNTSPDFTWPAPTGNTRWFSLEVDGSKTWHKELDVCSGNTCTVNLGTLSSGNHTWRLRARNLLDVGPWSGNVDFTVGNPVATPTPATPTGDQFFPTLPSPVTYTWNSVADATEYDLEIETSAGAAVDSENFDTSICSGGTCTATPADPLGEGAYRWRVRATGTCGPSAWSGYLTFTVNPETPAVPTPLQPLADTFDTTPTFLWTPSSGADEYDVEEDPPGTPVTFLASAACAGGECSGITGNTLAAGMHDWRVKARNPVPNESAYSASQSFEVLDCASFPDIDLTGNESGTPHHDACNLIEVAKSAPYTIETGADVTVHVSATGTMTFFNSFTIEDGADFAAIVDLP